MEREKLDYGVFKSPEFKSLERFILDTHNIMLTKLANKEVIDPTNMEFVYYRWLNYQGIRTGLKIWLNLITFIRLFHKRKRFNKEFITVMQGVLTGLKLPLEFLRYRKDENRQTSEPTKSGQVGNRANPDKVVEALLKGTV